MPLAATLRKNFGSPDSGVFDYQVAYEMVKRENESLSQTILKLNRDLDETSRVSTRWLFFCVVVLF